MEIFESEIFNVFGFPVTQCPMGLNKEGLPTGVQVVANHNCDHLTIKIAEHFESKLISWVQPSWGHFKKLIVFYSIEKKNL